MADVIVVVGTLDGAGDSGTRWPGAVSEDIRGFDARTGEHLWTLGAMPQGIEFGADTWGKGSARTRAISGGGAA